MAKTADELMRDGVRDALGNQLLQIIQLQAENTALRERLTQPDAPPPVASTSESPG